MKRRIAIGSLALLAGCWTVVEGVYDPAAFRDLPIDPAKKLDGCATVATSPEEDGRVWREPSPGRVGWRVELPLGTIAREAAVSVLGDLFRGGAVRSPAGVGPGPCGVVVTPTPTRLALRPARLGEKATFELSIRVEARSASGATLLAKPYDSGPWEAGRGAVDAVPQAAHVAMQVLMLRAAADLEAELARGAEPAAAGAGGSAPAR